MNITFLATGSPAPEFDRADGTSVVVSVEEETLLIDCGARSIHRMIENNINPADIQKLFFSHHHIDHNSSFFEFVFSGWLLGRQELLVYGPEKTRELIDIFKSLYSEDIARRQKTNKDYEERFNIEWHRMSPDLEVGGDNWKVAALPVKHTEADSYAYRIEDRNKTFVFSSDTAKYAPLAEFAYDADVLMHEATLGPIGAPPKDASLVWERYLDPLPQQAHERLAATHSTATEAAEIAADAEVDTLVLHHMLTYRDTEKMRQRAEKVFNGNVIIAEDGMTLAL